MRRFRRGGFRRSRRSFSRGRSRRRFGGRGRMRRLRIGHRM